MKMHDEGQELSGRNDEQLIVKKKEKRKGPSKLPEKEAEGASEKLEHDRKNKLEFDKRLAEWIQTIAKVTESEMPTQKEADAISVWSVWSATSSVRFKEAWAKMALAALKKKQLEETQHLQEQQ
ncbi:hypothetical protein HOLleu_41846 [Holothuria leucospilota]|uniref:Uncharacterized protein n=1 Tax=Holothuria leucospilota TaxID=206669 RepID=A0A9Q1B9W5_HOLLE|nr:hypothetical protein HOLleu_41846 [Holothuria leucospilota]